MFTLNNENMRIVCDNLQKLDYEFGKKLYDKISNYVNKQNEVEIYMYEELNQIYIGTSYLESLLKGDDTFSIFFELRDDTEDDIDYCDIEVIIPTQCLMIKNFNLNNYDFTLNLDKAEYCGELVCTLHYSDADIYFEGV